jgi:hypothetical protein
MTRLADADRHVSGHRDPLAIGACGSSSRPGGRHWCGKVPAHEQIVFRALQGSTSSVAVGLFAPSANSGKQIAI